MKMSELGLDGLKVKRLVHKALNSWEPRQNRKVRVVDVKHDMQTDRGGTVQAVVITSDRKRWYVRIDHGTFVEAALC